MRIVQVVSLFTPDGAFGGPTRVAVNQCRELLNRGHDVTLAGAAMGYRSGAPEAVDGVPVTLFPAHRVIPRIGFAGLTAPSLLTWFRHAAAGADAVHLHLARDLITLPLAGWALRSGTPYLVQPHGMIDAPRNGLGRLLDALATRRVLGGAGIALCLTPTEERELPGASAGQVATGRLPNGVPEAEPAGETCPLEVLFLARLQARKRPTAFVAAAVDLSGEFSDAQFTLVGPDEGEATAVGRQLAEAKAGRLRIRWEGPLAPELTLERFKRCAIYVLPAINEPFPMTVLEAMSVGKPVIVTDSCGLAGFVRETSSGLVVQDNGPSLRDGMRRLLADDALRADMGRNAIAAVRRRYGMPAVAEQLEDYYHRIATPESRVAERPRR